MADIVVVGSFVMDMNVRVKDFAKDGETLIANDFYMACGGKGVNQAVAAKRLGHSVEMVGMIGNDSYGKMFIDTLKEEGIEYRNVFVSEKSPTGMAHIQLNEDCQNRIVVIAGANAEFGEKELEAADAALREAKIVMVQFELNLDITKEVLRRAKSYGAITILNPAPARTVENDMIQYADYITPNNLELGALTGMPTNTVEECIAAARYLNSLGIKNVISTLGSDGALIVADGIEEVVPIFPVKVVDTVGAGDSFNGALAVKILENSDIREALLFANAEGALTVSQCGAIPALHTREQVELFLSENREKMTKVG